MESAGSATPSPPPNSGLSNGHADARDRDKPATSTLPLPTEDEQHLQVVPPYWQRHSHQRNDSTFSHASLENHRPTPIRLEDHTEADSDQSRALWARHVTIDDYVIVSGSAPGVGAYVVWNCTVETLNGGSMKIRKRYSEFDSLRRGLVKTFPYAEGSLPELPPKSVISKFRPRFLDRRKAGLSYFLNCVLLNPEFASSPVLKEFLFS